MRLFVSFCLAVSLQVHADEYSERQHDEIMGLEPRLELAPVIEQPSYPPARYESPGYQSDSEFSASVRQMDLEHEPRR